MSWWLSGGVGKKVWALGSRGSQMTFSGPLQGVALAVTVVAGPSGPSIDGMRFSLQNP